MIYGIFHKGSGLGNQLHRYVATMVLALDKGYEFSMVAPENFKGKDFMQLDMGSQPSLPYETEQPSGKVMPFVKITVPNKVIKSWTENTPYYNPEFNFIEDDTVIDGEFQDERYFGHRLTEIDRWINITYKTALTKEHDVCAIGFRGGEFKIFPELFLPKTYWDKGIEMMRKINPNMRFEVHTDDVETAQRFFPNFECIHDIERNWTAIRTAKYSIIANSSFYILPRLLKHDRWFKDGGQPLTIAPRYWARHNTKEWSMPQNYYRQFTYI